MTYVIDNGNANGVSIGEGRWTPKLNGAVYCSPACGFKCKKADFDRAMDGAAALVRQLGAGWSPSVWENGGWHFEAKKGGATVVVEADQFEASLRFCFEESHETLISATRSDPREAVEALIEQMNTRIATLRRALVSLSPSPLEITDV